MEGSSQMWAVALVSLLAAISPGPDFCIVVRNSLTYTRRAGLLTALGVSLALIIHLCYTLVGIGLVIVETPWLYGALQVTGVGYLFYLGISSIISSCKNGATLELSYKKASTDISSSKAVLQGFLTNLLNPKAALFFMSLFSQFISIDTPALLRVEYAFVNWSITLGWFLFLSYLITGSLFVSKIDRFRRYIDRSMGLCLLLLGMKLLKEMV